MALTELIVKLIGDVSGFQKTMNQVGRDIKKTGTSISSAGETLTKNFSVPLAGIATASLAMAAGFQSSMSKVKALGGMGEESMKRLENQALELGAQTQFSAKEAADGMGEFAAAGFNAEQIYDAMPGTLDLAAAAQISVGEAAAITVSTLGQFGLAASESGHVADVMAKSAALGALSITDLAESMKYVGPVAKTVGLSLEETSAAIATLSNAGIKGSDAGTSLRMGLIRMVKPTKEAQYTIDKYGLSLTDATGKVKPMVDIIGQLEQKQVSLADLTRLVGVNAVSGWAAMVGQGTEKLKENVIAVQNSDNAAKEMAATLRDNLKGGFEQMKGAVETLGITIGLALAPTAMKLMEMFQKLAEYGVSVAQAFRELDPQMQNTIIAFGGVVTVAGPIVFVIGKIITSIGTFIKLLGASQGAIALFTSATGIGLIVVALAAAVAAFVYFHEEINNALDLAAEYVRNFAIAVYDFMKPIVENAIEVWHQVSDAIAGALDIAWQYVSTWAGRIYDVISAAIDVWVALFDSFVEGVSSLFDSIVDIASAVFDVLVAVITDVLAGILTLFGTNFEEVKTFWAEVWDGAKIVFQAFGDAVGIILQGILDTFTNIGNGIVGVWNAAMNMIKSIFSTAFDIILEGLSYAQTIIGAFSDDGAAAIGKLRGAIENLKKPVEITTVALEGSKKSVDQLSGSIDKNMSVVEDNADAVQGGMSKWDKYSEMVSKVGDETKVTTTETKKNTDALKGNTSETDKNTKGRKGHSDATAKQSKEEKAHEKALKEEAKALDESTKELRELVEASKEYAELQKGLKDGTLTSVEYGKKLFELYDKGAGLTGDLAAAQANYNDALKAQLTTGNVPAEKIAELNKQLLDAQKNFDIFSNTKVKAPEIDGLDDFGKDIEKQIADGLGNIIKNALSGKSVREDIANLGGSMGGTFGSAAGAAFGGPFGEQLGGALGEIIGQKIGESVSNIGKSTKDTGKGIFTIIDTIMPGIGSGLDALIGDKLFGGDSEGTQTRKAIDKWFAEQFDANRIFVVINGQLQQLKDFDFGGGMFGSLDSEAGKFFSTLDTQSQASFSAVATGFTTMLGLGGDAVEGLAAVLAFGLGGSLNNLQVMVEGLGLNFEDMSKLVVESMLDGELSFVQAQSALNGLRQMAQKGIPDAIGATVTAFQNLKDAGVNGGRYSTDALRDIAFEAKELGIKTLPALMQNLVSSGKFSQKEIQMVFDALSKSGISSIEALTNATDEQLLGVLAQLQQQEFPFADAVDDAKDLTKAINDMPKSKDITFNLKTNLDSNTKAAMEAGFVPNASNTITSTPPIKQNAKGNAFSAGSVIPFAKGGVVSDFTMFPLGSMAERGPEAIMPLERLPNGDLGVRSASYDGPGGGGGETVINIHAPYAQPGVVETIKREVLKIMDKKNGLPGVRK